MASIEDIEQAYACLSVVFPEFTSKELANATDQIASVIQGFTDPLAAIGDLNVDSLVDDVAAISEGDIFENLSQATSGLLKQYTKREVDDLVAELNLSGSTGSITKRVTAILNMGSQVLGSVQLVSSLFSEMPYAAAQRSCAALVELTELKLANLECLKKHVIQLVNMVVALAKNVGTYKDDLFDDLDEVAELFTQVEAELAASQVISGGAVGFDSDAFSRAQDLLYSVSRLFAPVKSTTTILDLAYIATYGSVDSAAVTPSNAKLATLAIPSVANLIDNEGRAIFEQIKVINYYVESIAGAVDAYERSARSTKSEEARARSIASIKKKVVALHARVNAARAGKKLVAASGEMLLWTSRVKSIIAMMNRVKDSNLTAGSSEDSDKAILLAREYQTLVNALRRINTDETVNGIENESELMSKVQGLTKGALRIMDDLQMGRADENRMKNFHALAIELATTATSMVDDSAYVARTQRTACNAFLAIEVGIGETFDKLLAMMRQTGLDRGVDLLTAGRFDEVLDADINSLSYVGKAIACLTNALSAVDDARTRSQIANIRDQLIGKQTNQYVAAVDTADQGRSKLVGKLQSQISGIQKNAKTVESILAHLKSLGEQAGANLGALLSTATAFAGNLDHLTVGSGGRLAGNLEQYAKYPNTGTPSCNES